MTKKTTASHTSDVTCPEKATPDVDKTAEKPVEKPVETSQENSASTRIIPQMEFVAPDDMFLQLITPDRLQKGRKAVGYLYVPMGWYEGYLNPEVKLARGSCSTRSCGVLALVEKDPSRNKENLEAFKMKKGDVLSAVKGKGIFMKNSEGKTISSLKLNDCLSPEKLFNTVFSVKESKTEPVRVSLIPMSDVVELKLKIKGFIRAYGGQTFRGLNSNIVAPKEGVFAVVLTDKLPDDYFESKPNYTFTLNPGGRIKFYSRSCNDVIKVVPSNNVLEEEIFAS